MEICNHVINEREIVGIGPLMIEQKQTALTEIFNTKRLYFYIHCKNQSIRIETDAMDFAGIDPARIELNKKFWYEFEAGYKKAKNEIIKMLDDGEK